MKGFDVIAKHRGERQRTKALHKRDKAGRDDGCNFPTQRPVQGIVLVIRRLGDQDSMALIPALDKMVRSNIGHKLSTWNQLDLELLLDLMELLQKM